MRNLVKPIRAGRRLANANWEARLDEANRTKHGGFITAFAGSHSTAERMRQIAPEGSATIHSGLICEASARAEGLAMAVVVITCPNTGERIRGIVKNVANAHTPERFELVECLACWQIHYVSPATGKVLGQDKALALDRQRLS